jgi:hypothetical protein
VLIVTSAAVSLLLVGLLALAVTPDHTSAPIAGHATVGSPSPRSFPVAIASSAALTTARLDRDLPVVTPVGDEGWAVTTWEAVAGQTGATDARLPSGEVVEIEIIGKDPAAGLVVVTLPAATEGYRLAADRPNPTDTVYVNADEPRVVMLDDLVWLDVAEATPVLDGAGALIGLCTTGGRDGTTLMTVDTMPGASPDEPGAGSTTEVETTVPTTPADDSTTVGSTSPASTDPETSVTDSTIVVTTAESTAPPTTELTATTTTTLVATTDR